MNILPGLPPVKMPRPRWLKNFPKGLSLRKKGSYHLKNKEERGIGRTPVHVADGWTYMNGEVVSTSEEDLLALLHKSFRKPGDPVSFTDLPDEVLLHIVSYINPLGETFTNLNQTCRRLHVITEDLSLFPHRHLRIPPYAMFSFDTLRLILDVSRSMLTSLDLSECEDINDYTLFRLVCNFDQLVKLDISGCKQLTNAALRVAGNYTTNLEWIDFSACPLITCAGVLQLFQSLGKTLRHVNMSNCLGIRKDPHKLTAISKHFSVLQYLAVGWSRDLVKLNPLLDMDLDRLTKGCSQLTFLDISYSHSTNTSMTTITDNCPLLETLLAKQCFVQDNGLKSIGEGLPHLKQLDLTDCWYITDVGLEHIAKGCAQLETINLTRCYEIRGNGTVVLASHCRQLNSIILRQCFRVDEQAVQYVGLCNPKLHHLDFSFNMNVTMDTVKLIKRRRPRVRLITEGCPGVSFFGSKSRFQFFLKGDLDHKHPTPKRFPLYRETAV